MPSADLELPPGFASVLACTAEDVDGAVGALRGDVGAGRVCATVGFDIECVRRRRARYRADVRAAPLRAHPPDARVPFGGAGGR